MRVPLRLNGFCSLGAELCHSMAQALRGIMRGSQQSGNGVLNVVLAPSNLALNQFCGGFEFVDVALIFLCRFCAFSRAVSGIA